MSLMLYDVKCYENGLANHVDEILAAVFVPPRQVSTISGVIEGMRKSLCLL